MFSLLLNELPNFIRGAQILMFADDVAAIVTGRTVESLEQQLQHVAGALADWFYTNGLALNLRKTQLMHFNLAGRLYRPLHVHVHTANLPQVNEMRFLGFTLDRGLKWDIHIEWLCGRLGSACFALSRLASTVPQCVVRTCYFATIQSLVTYGLELWGRAADWHRVFVLQKRAVRIIARANYDDSARPLFTELGIMTMPSLYILQVAIFVYQNLELYEVRKSGRAAGKLITVPHKLVKTERSVYVYGPKVFNKLPVAVTSAPSFSCFKLRLKAWLVQQAFYSVDEFLVLKL